MSDHLRKNVLHSLPIYIPSELCGQRIDVALATLFPDYSRSQLTSALKAGAILINHQCYKPKDKIKGNELIEFQSSILPQQHDLTLEPEAIDLNIIYEDEALLVINKPAGLVVHPGAGQPNQTLVNGLLHHCPALQQLPRAGLIHRLDQHTTGLLLVGKTLTSYNKLTENMRLRLIKRHYLALAQGQLTTPNTITTSYGRDPKNRLKMAVRREGKDAITHYRPLKIFPHFSLLHIELQTGRTHQIRVHMAYLKHPIVGDPLYGKPPALPKTPDPSFLSAIKQFKRQALHAYTLSFEHPVTAENITLEAPLPDDFRLLLDMVEQHDV